MFKLLIFVALVAPASGFAFSDTRNVDRTDIQIQLLRNILQQESISQQKADSIDRSLKKIEELIKTDIQYQNEILRQLQLLNNK